MLTISPINSLEYYNDLASEDYYHKGGEPLGKWGGIGSHLLGLEGQIDVEDYGKIFTGFDPKSDTALFNQSVSSHRAGLDCTLSCPKSYSLLWARSNSELRYKLEQAQQKAVEETISFLEEIAKTRRGHDGVEHEKVAGLVTSSYPHCTSRAQDPQCHTHLLVANCAPRMDGTWGTLDYRYFYQHMKAGGAIFRNSLANQLQVMGFTIERNEEDNSFFKISGVSDELCKFYSKRGNEIRDIAERLGIKPSSKAGKKITLNTRQHKQKINRAELFERWGHEMDERGFSHADARALQNKPIQNCTPLPIKQIVENLTINKSVLHMADIIEAVTIEATFHQLDYHAAKHCIKEMIEHGLILELENDDKFNLLFTTPQMEAIEQQMFQDAVQLNSNSQYQLNIQTIQYALNQQVKKQGFMLSEEQTEAVINVCQSSFDILQGSAGAGKSTAMSAVKLAYEQSGVQVIGACTAKQAANQLQSETGIPSFTIAKLLIDIESGRRSLKNTVLIVDESGQVSSRDMQKLTALTKENESKLILVGEDKQMQAIQNPGAMGYLASTLGSSRINTIRRQREEWSCKAVMQMRDGHTLPALTAHDHRGLIHWCNDQEDTVNLLVQHWHRYQQKQPNKNSLIIANTWAEVQSISDKVRMLRQADGHVGNENIKLECSVSGKQRDFCYSVGDRIKLTKNNHRLKFDNGTFGTIQKIKEKSDGQYCFTIESDDQRILHVHTDQYCDDKSRPYIALAYALTTYSSQGSTVDETFILHNNQMNRAASYVASSRHRDNCNYFVNSDAVEANMYLNDNEQITAQKRLETLALMMAKDKHPLTTLHYSHSQNKDYLKEIRTNRKEQKQHLEVEAC